MNQRALAGHKKVLGLDYPNTLTSVYCLAHLFSGLNDHHQAFDLYERAIIGYSKLLGPEHPNTVACQRHKTSLRRSSSERPADVLPSSREAGHVW